MSKEDDNVGSRETIARRLDARVKMISEVALSSPNFNVLVSEESLQEKRQRQYILHSLGVRRYQY
jgi:hypothetical protein